MYVNMRARASSQRIRLFILFVYFYFIPTMTVSLTLQSDLGVGCPGLGAVAHVFTLSRALGLTSCLLGRVWGGGLFNSLSTRDEKSCIAHRS